MSNVTLNNQGTTNYATGSGTFFFLNNGAIFDNNGVFDFQADAIVSSGTLDGVFNNNASGQILKSNGLGTGAFGSGVNLNNTDGSFNATAGNIELQGATTMNGVLSNLGNDLLFDSSSISFADGSSVNGNLALVGGTVNIAGTVTMNDTLNWAGTSTIAGPGTLVLAASSVLNLTGNVSHVLSNVTLDNQGSTRYATGGGTFFFLNNGAIFDNNGTFDFQADAIVSSGTANGVFNNNASGQILKTAGAGNSAFGSGVSLTNNDGLFNASSGAIQLQGATLFNGVLTNTGSDLQLNSSAISFADGSSVNGNLALIGGTVNLLGTTTINDTLNWTGTSTIAGPGTLVLAAGSVLNLTGNVNHILSNVTLNNQGTTNYATGGGTFFFLNDNAVFDNNGTSIFRQMPSSAVARRMVCSTIMSAGS